LTTKAITIFVPAFNEAANLEGTVGDVLTATANLDDREVIVVDDGSTDGTGELADELAVRSACVRVLHNPTNFGLAAGYRRALAEARMEYFTFVPGDREVSAQSIKDILGLVGSADVIVPYHANSQARAWHRRLLTRASTALINLLFGFRLRYYQGPCVYRTALARSLRTSTNGFFFLTEMLVQALRRGHSYVEVGLIHQERSYGRSKAVSLRNIGRALATIVRLWWSLRVRPVVSRTTENPT
jgi:glycosyltransferase involved in cell wall biosynthesis